METILIVEPEQIAREALVTMLSDEGYRPVGVKDARHAILALHDPSVPDLVVLANATDDAETILDLLVREERLRDIPLIVLSSEPYDSRFSAAVAFFRTPIKPAEFLDKVRQWVRDSYQGQARLKPSAQSPGRTRS